MFYRKKKMIRKKYAICACCVLLLAGALCGCAEGDGDKMAEDQTSQSGTSQAKDQKLAADEPQDAEEGTKEEAIVFESQDIEGNLVTSDIFGQSKLTMINVWATYCNPCLSEMPELGELAGEYDATQFQLIGIISDVPEAMEGVDKEKAEKARDEAKGLIEETGADYPHLLLNVSLFEALLTDVTAVPTTFFIDQEGNVLDQVVGARDKESWKEIIDALLEEL